jgi:tetratricopeptide (TPR) repeat protein
MRKPIHPILTLVAAVLAAVGCVSCSPQAKKAGHLKQADGFFDSGQYDKAEIEYMNVRQLEPLNPQAIGRLGLIYFDQGRVGRVIPYLTKGKELQPDNLDIRRRLGLVSLSTGSLARAREEAGFILDRNPLDEEAPLILADATTAKPEEIEATRQRLIHLPAPASDSASVQLALGTLELKQRHFKEAEIALRRAVALDPKSSAAQAAMGNWYRVKNDLPQAEQAFKRAAEFAPARSPRGLLYAKFKIQAGDAVTGRKALEEITRKTPDYLPAWILLAELAAAEKKFPESATFLAKVLALDPAHPEALLLSGRLKLAQGEKDNAVAEMGRMLKIYPQSPQAHYQLGLAYYVSGDSQKAMTSLTQAVALAPGYAEAIVLLAELNIRNGTPRIAITALKSLLQQRPEIVQARFLLADAYRNQGELNEAVAIYVQMEESYPKNPQPPQLRGTILLQQNRLADARAALTKALALAPDFLLALDQLVSLDLYEKNYAAARQRVDSQIAKDPKLPGLYLLQAKVYLVQKESALAEAALRKSIELQPDSPAAYLMLARLYAGSNQLDKALTNFQAAVDKNPKNVEALMMIGTIHNQRKNFTAAKEAYEKLLLVNPRFSPALNNLAYLYSEEFHQWDKAQELAQKAVELLPHEPHMADTLGWILFKKQQYPWALSLLLESAGKLSDSAEVQFHLGMTHYMMGAQEAARRALQHAMQLDKEFPGNDEARRCLSVLAVDTRTAGAGDLAALEKMIAERPDDPVALARLAAIYTRGGAAAKAIATYQIALRASPKNVAVMMELARLYAASGEITKALDLAKNARKLAPDDPDVAHTLGRLTYQTGDHLWALSLLQEAARKMPDDPELLYDLAEAAYGVGRVSDADSAMRRALETGAIFQRANEARLFLEMTALAASPTQAVAAAAKVEQVLKSNPNHVPALMASAAISEKKSDEGAARQVYEKVLGLFPEFAPAKRRLAVFYAENPGDNSKAYELAIKARDAFPDDIELARALGIIAYRQNDFVRAAKVLLECAKQREDDAVLMYFLGLTQYKLKQRSESRQSLQRALDLHLRADLAVEARKILAELK